MSVAGGRFVEPDITAGVTPRVEVVSEQTPPTREPPAAVKLLMGQFTSEMTVAQWQEFTKRVDKALQLEGLAR